MPDHELLFGGAPDSTALTANDGFDVAVDAGRVLREGNIMVKQAIGCDSLRHCCHRKIRPDRAEQKNRGG
jgi:hypothetical protein